MPAIMFERAAQVADDDLVETVLVRCSEPNATNFGYLKAVCDDLTHPKVTVHPTQETFEDIAQKFIAYASKQQTPPPTFIMVDPYGIKGVKLETLRALLQLDRLEIFLTFMVRDPSRFLEGNYGEALTELFAGDAWEACKDAADRSECLMRTFQHVVTKDVANYVLPYKVHEDEKQTVLYYLVHLTNNDRGMRVMKEKMIKKSGEMTFFPITLRPTDQLGLDVAEAKPYPSLQRYLSETYSGRTIRFVDLLNEDYPLGHSWIEGQYKETLKAMEVGTPPGVQIARKDPLTKQGKPSKAIGPRDELAFPSAASL